MASTGGGGMGMGGGPDSAPGGSSSSSGTGNAPGEGMGAGAFDGGGGASKDTSTIEGFMEAIARAIGHKSVSVDQESIDNMNEEAANNRAIAAAVEAKNRTQREAREQQERQAMMDDIDVMQNKTNFATPAPAVKAVDLDTYDAKFASPHNMVDETETEKEYGPTFSGMTSPFGIDESQLDDPTDDSPVKPSSIAHLSTYHGQNTRNFNTTGFDPSRSTGLHDPQGTEAGLAAAQEAMDGLSAGSRTIGAHPSRDPRIGMPMGVGRPTPTDQQENREPVDMYGRVAPIEDIEDPEERAKAYEMLGKLQKAAKEARTPWGKALNTIMGYAINAVPGIGQLNMIGKAIKAGFNKAGFNVDPNIIGQAIRAAHEQTTQGPLGAGGTSVGSRNDSFIENFLANLPSEEPWMQGLNERQIQYYLDRPSELEWVRNLYNQMNPS